MIVAGLVGCDGSAVDPKTRAKGLQTDETGGDRFQPSDPSYSTDLPSLQIKEAEPKLKHEADVRSAALFQSDGTTTTASQDDVDRDKTIPIVEVEWDQAMLRSRGQQRIITYAVTNRTEISLMVDLKASCSGLINRHAELALESLTLVPGETRELSIAADALPIQSIHGPGHVRIFAEITEIDASTESEALTRRPTESSIELYYIHARNFSMVRVFLERDLFNVIGGHLGGSTPANPLAGNGKLGRVLKNDGSNEYEEVSLDDASYELMGEDGRSLGRITGEDVSEAIEEEEGNEVEVRYVAGQRQEVRYER
ncbi:MAG: hypothetical protein QNJ97_15880 [Myxococcota bacterium]|nr:hypothetical protein [Myxococcota bacterium]